MKPLIRKYCNERRQVHLNCLKKKWDDEHKLQGTEVHAFTQHVEQDGNTGYGDSDFVSIIATNAGKAAHNS